ncbi:MAG: alpha/beta hydrolase [Nannocystis sp.]|uniref:alpha/beta hydrolase n=1 Tax=Nannocystis sp. TaxID=1962667 RepID=UPI002427168F|nr:alpha/beta hydrolase [Nannocystis sp.]MBK9753947.1 alpha/beta hydrolase [Nannocystis sp.]
MSWALLGVGVVAAAAVFNAYIPARLRWLIVPGFFAAWLTIELALHLLIGGAALVTWLALAGGLSDWRGGLGLGLCVVAGGGLVGLYLRSRGGAAALTEFYREAGIEAVGEVPRFPRSHIAIPWLTFHRRDVEVRRGVPFCEVAGQTLCLDVYSPRAPGRRRPAIVQVHGGAWFLGFKEYQGIPLLTHLARHGWVGFNVDYRLSPKATFPAHLIDVKRAIAWVREHADEYGVDPDFIVVTGGSAGGHLAALVGLTAGDPEYQPGFEAADTSVRAAVVFYGVLDLKNRKYRGLLERVVLKVRYAEHPELFLRASPIDRVHAGAPPFLVIHGSRDTLCAVEDARRFVAALRGVSHAPVRYLEMKGAEHAFDIFASVRTVPVIEAVERFLAAQHRDYLASMAASTAASVVESTVADAVANAGTNAVAAETAAAFAAGSAQAPAT